MVGNIGIIVMVTALLIVGINNMNQNNKKEEIKFKLSKNILL